MPDFKNNNLSEYHIVRLEVVFTDKHTNNVDADVILVSDAGLVIGPMPLKNLKTPDIEERVADLLSACYRNLNKAFGVGIPVQTTNSTPAALEPPPGFGDEDFNI